MIAVDDRNRLGDEKNPELLFLEMPPARPKKVSEEPLVAPSVNAAKLEAARRRSHSRQSAARYCDEP
jgi:hypothetical protein